MKKYLFIQSQFLQSALEDLPTFFDSNHNPFPEIAFVGKSNVGKSSLINHLLKRKKLAKVSSQPGKTQTINFFKIDETLILVDFPGYGYATRAKHLQQLWNESIDRYMNTRSALVLLVLLIDIRRGPEEEELSLAKWAQHHKKSLLVIFTKTDTLNEKEVKINLKKSLDLLFIQNYLMYSIKESFSRNMLINVLNKLLNQNI